MWYGKTRVASWKLKSTSWNSNPRITSSNPRVTNSNPRVTSSNLRVASSNPQVTSSNPRVQDSLNHQIIKALIKSSSFPTTISPKLFGNLWGNLCVQFLVIISCFTFPLLWKKRPKFSTEKSPSPRWFWRNLLFPLVNVTDFSFIFLTQIFVLCL